MAHLEGAQLEGPAAAAGWVHAARRVGISATFSAAPIEAPLKLWLDRRGPDVDVTLAPYGQVIEQLAGANSALAGSTDVGVVLIHLEDCLRSEVGGPRADRTEEAGPRVDRSALTAGRLRVAEICTALSACADVTGTRLLLGLMPESEAASADAAVAAFVADARRDLLAVAETHDRVDALAIDAALDLYEVAEAHDPFRDSLAHIPFTDECMAAVATAIARALRALWADPCKVIVLDCDNTLWRGACGEDPIDALDPSGPYEELRRLMVDQARDGRLLCLASRNLEADVVAAFERHGAPLTGRHIAARRVCWGRKSDSLRSLSEELGVGLESFVFIDDDPVECAEVKGALPDVVVVQLPADPGEIPRALRHVWALDRPFVTSEDRGRAATQAADARRRREQARAPSASEFVEGLRVEVDVRPLEPGDLPRAQQLFQRTNQFNATGARRTERELRDHAAEPGQQAWVAHVRDRLGDYGLVGLMLTTLEERTLRVTAMLVSCRVFNRGVEGRMLAAIGDSGRRLGCDSLTVDFRPTDRNGPARQFLDRLVDEAGDGHHRAGDRYGEAGPVGGGGYRIPIGSLADRVARAGP